MMFGAPKKCAKCDKQVYPIEELKCLDKIWHKNCFRCSVCNSVLNMKNYKGFNKTPYCCAHYPQQKPTVVSENPELLRIKENTKIQSTARYHEDFEKNKGIYTVVADDPETRRVLENTKNISQVKYHEDFERKKNYTPMMDHPETTRAIENQKNFSSIEYKSSKHQQINQPTYLANSTNSARPALIATFKDGEKKIVESQIKKIGSIADYDPLINETLKNSQINTNNNLNRNPNGMNKLTNFSTGNLYQPQPKIQTFSSSSNINYANDYTKANSNGNLNGQLSQSNSSYSLSNSHNSNNNFVLNQPDEYEIQVGLDSNDIKTSVYKAIYDYDGKEEDEISFRDGDKFINCEQIDVGWMIGVHEKTGRHGMFPANYAEPVDYF